MEIAKFAGGLFNLHSNMDRLKRVGAVLEGFDGKDLHSNMDRLKPRNPVIMIAIFNNLHSNMDRLKPKILTCYYYGV